MLGIPRAVARGKASRGCALCWLLASSAFHAHAQDQHTTSVAARRGPFSGTQIEQACGSSSAPRTPFSCYAALEGVRGSGDLVFRTDGSITLSAAATTTRRCTANDYAFGDVSINEQLTLQFDKPTPGGPTLTPPFTLTASMARDFATDPDAMTTNNAVSAFVSLGGKTLLNVYKYPGGNITQNDAFSVTFNAASQSVALSAFVDANSTVFSSGCNPFAAAGTSRITLTLAGFSAVDSQGRPARVIAFRQANPAERFRDVVFDSATCPTIAVDPAPGRACRVVPVQFTVGASGPGPLTYQWQVAPTVVGPWTTITNGDALSGGGELLYSASAADTSSLSISPTINLAAQWQSRVGFVRCTLSNACGPVTSNPAELTICAADFNCDEFTDAIDYDLFIAAWVSSDASSDINADGFSDAIDYDVFVAAWLTGC